MSPCPHHLQLAAVPASCNMHTAQQSTRLCAASEGSLATTTTVSGVCHSRRLDSHTPRNATQQKPPWCQTAHPTHGSHHRKPTRHRLIGGAVAFAGANHVVAVSCCRVAAWRPFRRPNNAKQFEVGAIAQIKRSHTVLACDTGIGHRRRYHKQAPVRDER